jgi:hypothetical protein
MIVFLLLVFAGIVVGVINGIIDVKTGRNR